MLFVYGTLRRGCGNDWARLLERTSEFLGHGRIRGTLYRVAHYPGLKEEDSNSRVCGELWRVPEDVLARLDEYEGEEYDRVERLIETESGPVRAWVYLFLPSAEGKEPIASGDWLASA